MVGKINKKSADNFEKIKREMKTKKQNAKIEENMEVVSSHSDNNKLEMTLDIREGFQNQSKSLETLNGSIVGVENGVEINKEDETDMVEILPQGENEDVLTEIKKIEMVVFQVGEEEFAFRIYDIKEIIRIPSMTKVHNAPFYVTGLCSLRGGLLPAIDSRKLFGMPDKEYTDSSRIVVSDIYGEKFGLIVDRISEVISVEESAIKEPPGTIKEIDGGAVDGILLLDDGKRVVMVLDTHKIIKAGDVEEYSNQPAEGVDNSCQASNIEDLKEEQIVIFNIGNEEYAFSINCVKEIIRMPDITKTPNTSAYIEGMLSIRNQLLAAINLRSVLGMEYKQPDEYSRIVIINTGNLTFGVIVDKVSQVMRVKKSSFKESRQGTFGTRMEIVRGFFNLDNGNRLVMALEPHKLVSVEDINCILNEDCEKNEKNKTINTGKQENNLKHIVIFKLDEEEFGIDISNIKEINRLNDIVHFPGAPHFIDGMTNLRGDVIPLLNLKALFNKNLCNYQSSKFLVVESGNKRAGIRIDYVSEVLRFSKKYLEEPPKAFDRNDNYIDKIVKLNDGKRIVLILKPDVLLSFM